MSVGGSSVTFVPGAYVREVDAAETELEPSSPTVVGRASSPAAMLFSGNGKVSLEEEVESTALGEGTVERFLLSGSYASTHEATLHVHWTHRHCESSCRPPRDDDPIIEDAMMNVRGIVQVISPEQIAFSGTTFRRTTCREGHSITAKSGGFGEGSTLLPGPIRFL